MNDRPLSGYRVLVTRPRAQADAWRERLHAAGAITLDAPLLEIAPWDTGLSASARSQHALWAQLDALDRYDKAIFVSGNAVAQMLRLLDERQLSWPSRTQAYAVGAATAAKLSSANIAVEAADGEMNSEALLNRPSLQHLVGQRILICRGEGGRPTLADECEARGAEVDFAALYRREFPQTTQDFLASTNFGQPTDIVVLHSGEALQNWCRIITDLKRPEWLALPTLIPGKRVAELAKVAGLSQSLVSLNASETCMLETLSSGFHSDR